MLSRRAMVGKLAAGVAGTAVALAATGGRATAVGRRTTDTPIGSGSDGDPIAPAVNAERDVIDTGPQVTESACPPWELLRPLAKGAVVANGWHVAELSGVVDGSCVLTLQNARGRAHRVHLCRNDGRPQGVVYTKRLDLVVMNGGQGDLPTEEGLAQAVAEVAHVLAANESGWGTAEVVTGLLPHAERVRLFAGPVDRRLR